MKKSIIEMILEFFRQIRRKKRWRNTVTCMAALIVFVTTYVLILPAITMGSSHPRLSAETVTAWAGDPMSVTVSAESPSGSGEKVVVLTTEAVDAGLSEAAVDISPACTCCHPEEFHSHRATGGRRGAMGAVIGILPR